MSGRDRPVVARGVAQIDNRFAAKWHLSPVNADDRKLPRISPRQPLTPLPALDLK